jgi:uncharacterized membrane protein
VSDADSSYRTVRAHSLERTIVFTDAAVAIALTLLVLPLVDLVPDIGDESLLTLLSEHWSDLFSFVLSFFVIANLWTVHRDIYQLVLDYDGVLVALNFLWLLAVVFLPFPTALLTVEGQVTSGGAVLYLGTLLANALLALAQGWWIGRHPGLWRPHVTPALLRHRFRAGTAVCLVEALATGVAAVNARWGLSTLLLLVVVGRLTRER